MKIIKYPDKAQWNALIKRQQIGYRNLVDEVSKIIQDVRQNGDKAVRYFTEQFDKVVLDDLSVPESEIFESGITIKGQLKKAIEIARSNIEKFHSSQKALNKLVVTTPGVRCWQRSEPVEKVGLYVPGGTAPLISTVLMLGIPAKLAGCNEVVLCTPPDREGKIHPAILYAASILGIRSVYRVGGVQAIAAMAYGTESIPGVYKIFGPGNRYVTVAKQLVAMESVAIDLPAGPSELAVITDKSARADFVASDLLSQAEHGIDSQVLLVTTSEKLIHTVQEKLEQQISNLPRKDFASETIKNSKLILMKNEQQMIDLVNDYAPEHLIINTENYMELGNKIKNAGSVFLGPYTPVSAGDYASGTNHTLPTNGAARSYSGITVGSFQKIISFQEISDYGLYNIGSTVTQLAEAEGLLAHGRAVTIRFNSLSEEKFKK